MEELLNAFGRREVGARGHYRGRLPAYYLCCEGWTGYRDNTIAIKHIRCNLTHPGKRVLLYPFGRHNDHGVAHEVRLRRLCNDSGHMRRGYQNDEFGTRHHILDFGGRNEGGCQHDAVEEAIGV
jgi:hypothetical protein